MKSAGNPGEEICLDSKALQNGGKQPSKRFRLGYHTEALRAHRHDLQPPPLLSAT
jgi:hypothetical protein